MKVKLIVDSVADLNKDLIKEFDITVLPLRVNFGEQSYLDGIELTSKEFFEKLASAKQLPSTSQISFGEFLEYFAALKSDNTYIYLSMASKLSGTYNSAMMAKNEMQADNIYVIDSEAVTGDYGVMAIALAKLIHKGVSLDRLLALAKTITAHTETKVALDTLEYLQRGGRLNMTSAIIGEMLKVKPIIVRKDGQLVMSTKVRGRKKVLHLIRQWLENYDLNHKVITLTYAVDYDYLLEVKNLILTLFPAAEIHILEAGSVVGTHSGKGMIGVSFVNLDLEQIAIEE